MVPVITVHRGLSPPKCTSLLDTPGESACPTRRNALRAKVGQALPPVNLIDEAQYTPSRFDKIPRTLDDDESSWNLLILREYKSLAQMEADEEKSDALSRQALGVDDQKEMQGYEDRSKIREILSTRTARELILK